MPYLTELCRYFIRMCELSSTGLCRDSKSEPYQCGVFNRLCFLPYNKSGVDTCKYKSRLFPINHGTRHTGLCSMPYYRELHRCFIRLCELPSTGLCRDSKSEPYQCRVFNRLCFLSFHKSGLVTCNGKSRLFPINLGPRHTGLCSMSYNRKLLRCVIRLCELSSARLRSDQ